jgi:hypothetical protein
VSEGVLRGARVEGGRLRYGSRSYDTLLVMDAVSLEPETAEAIASFGESGGRVAFLGRSPDRAPGLRDAPEADRRVEDAIARLLAPGAGRAAVVPAPSGGLLPPGNYTRGVLPDAARRELLRWVVATMPRLGALPDVAVGAPHEDVGLVHHRAGEREIFFLANASRTEAREVEARFPTGDRRPWRWDLETGTRAPIPFSGRPDTLALHLEPLESLLLVFEPPVIPTSPVSPSEEGSALRPGREWLPVVAPWDVALRPAGGTPFTRRFPQLFDLSLAADDPEVAGFGGVAVYRAEFEWTDTTRTLLGLGTVHGVSAVRLNGKDLGARWWGRHLYEARGALEKGRNVLEVEVTTTLGNRMRSLEDNPVAKGWAWWFPPIPMGLVGPVHLMKPAE